MDAKKGFFMSKFGPLFVLLLSITLIAGCSISIDIRRPSEAMNEVEMLMQQYFDAFNATDVEAVKACWHVPGWVSNGQENRTIESVDQLTSTYSALFEQLKEEGWDHSELIKEEIEIINDTLATVRIHFRRVDQNGEVMLPEEREAMLKVMLFDGEWKITTQAVTSSK